MRTLTIAAVADQTFTGAAITPAPAVSLDGVTLKAGTDYELSYANNVGIGTATITAAGKGNYAGCAGSATFRIVPVKGDPDVTERTRTDGDNSGVLNIGNSTTEDFAIFDALKELAASGKLANGVSYDAKAIPATSADVAADVQLFTSADIKKAVSEYWELGAESASKVRLVDVSNTVASRAAEGETIFAKFWKMLVSVFTGSNAGTAAGDGDYLPIQANFAIRSADVATLPDEVKNELTSSNLLDKINLFTVTKDASGAIYARSLGDAAGGDRKAYITVTGDNASGYAVKTRVMLFDMEGGVSGDKTAGAKWVQPLKAASSDARANDKDNYFIVQDGAADRAYNLCLAFAAKESNLSAVSVTVSGDVTSSDREYVRWAISGDAAQRPAGSSADISGGTHSVTITLIPDDYSVTLSDETQALAKDVKTITASVPWGGEWKITALLEKTAVESVTLDRTSIVMAVGGSDKLTATVMPETAKDKSVVWTSDAAAIAAVDESGTISAASAGKATITATAADGSGKSASCIVTVRKAAGGDPETPAVTPEVTKHEIVRPAGIDLAENTAGYVTSAGGQDGVISVTGFTDETTAVGAAGELTAADEIVKSAVDDVIANNPAISKDVACTLPIVESSADKAGQLHAISFKVSGDIFGEVADVTGISVLKVFPDGKGELFTPVTASGDIADKTVALYDGGNAMVTEAVDGSASYILTAFVKDGGTFDLDGQEDGRVIDPISIIKAKAAPPKPKPASEGGSCDTGAGALALLALAPLAMRKKKR